MTNIHTKNKRKAQKAHLITLDYSSEGDLTPKGQMEDFVASDGRVGLANGKYCHYDKEKGILVEI